MNPPPRPQATSLQPLPATPPTRIHSEPLFAAGREVLIVHRGEEYRLRITRQDKLILTK